MKKIDWMRITVFVAAVLMVLVVALGFLALLVGPLRGTGGLRAIAPSRGWPHGHRLVPFGSRGSRLGLTSILWPISGILRLGVLVFLVLGGIWLVRHITDRRAPEPPAPRCPGCGQEVQGDWKHCPHCGELVNSGD